MCNVNQSAEYEYSAEYKAEIEALVKAEIKAAQDKVASATFAHTMTGRIASRESEQLIDALFAYVRLLENIIAFGPSVGEDIFN